MVYNFSLLEISNANSNSTFPLIIAVGLLGLTVLITIFLFKKRVIQIRTTQVVLLAHIALLVAFFYVSDSIGKKIGADAVYDVAAYLALIPLVFLVLANRAIIKDEKLVRSTDRLRD
jgi:peptidoglycan/LPS O-acetylase OafA/YrhL